MSVGFPPTIANTITGHGCERQILRDYLSFAVAIYGENDSWWKNIGGIVYGQLVPPRDFYFKSGVAHQGPYYSSGRHISDLYSAWILKVATDSIPYTGIENTVRGFLGYEISAGLMFDDGDGHTGGEGLDIATYKSLAFITAYLFGDGGMLAQAEHLLGDAAFSNDVSGLTSPLYVALRGLCDIDAATDRYSGMPLIQYNGSPLGQYIIRQAWNSADSATVFMRIKEVTTGNHEHEDTGTFQIYYKGMLTNDGGVYNNYGHVQTRYYYSSTIAHNGLIVFNPNKSSYGDSSAKDNVKWYSGGQIRASEESQTNGRYFLDDNGAVTAHYQRGEIVGRQHGYDNVGTPLYAYIAGNITKAYDSATVNYVGRRMLTVYTGDADFPMVFFVYDDITSDSASYEKRFLLQITSPNAPTIKGQYDAWNGTAYVTEGNAVASGEFASITTENGGGRLVLTSLSDNVKFRLAGGRNEGAYSAADSFNYTVIVQHNGQLTPVQCVPRSNTADDGHWGRVEIVSTAGSTDAKFMNVLYVTDAGQTKTAPAVTEITNKNGLEGGSFAGVAALFATSRTRSTSTLSATVSGDGDMSYYVSGVAAGEWEITVDGTSYGTAIATEEGGLLTFTAPAGQVVITPAN